MRTAMIVPWLAIGFHAASGLAQPRGEPRYVGDNVCRSCHPSEATAFEKTGMGRSMSVPARGDLDHPVRVQGSGATTYTVSAREGRIYQESLRGGAVLESHQVLYAIGSGEHGRSYVIARGDSLFLAPLSFYTPSASWDLSPGYAAGAYRDFLRPVSISCVFCHAGNPRPASGAANRFLQPPFAALAISCERCHGPGEAHAQGASAAIVNPAKLAGQLRDDVCFQCHLGGDIRVIRPGRTEMEFRPGAYLDDTVAIFSVPPRAKPEGLDAVGQAGQLRLSRCWKESQGRLGCTTCHDPHVERGGPAAVSYYRGRCQTCHARRPCAASLKTRNATAPPDNCVSCHMPRNPLNRIAHIAHTNHRILRRAEEALNPEPDSSLATDLLYETGRPGRQLDLRTRALAYAEAARGLPAFTGRALSLLDAAVKADPHDPELSGSLGLLLLKAGGSRAAESVELLQSAADSGSRSAAVRLALCDSLAARGELDRAVRGCRDAIALAPFDPPPYLRLIRIYLQQRDRASASEIFEHLRGFDPANPESANLAKQIAEVR
jgi:hypothetical protein